MKQKLRSAIFSLLLLSSLLLAPAAYADDSPSFTVITDSNFVRVNQEVNVTINGSELNDVFAFELHLYYDPELLEPKLTSAKSEFGGTNGGLTVPAKVYKGEDEKSYVLLARTKYDSDQGENGDATLFTMTFQAKKAGTAELALNQVKLIDSKVVTTTPTVNSKTAVYISNASTNSSTSPVVQGSVLTVMPDQLNASSSTVELTVPEQVTEIQLPSQAALILNGKSLKLNGNQFSMTIPAGNFTQLTQMAGSSSEDDVISIYVIPVADANDESKYVEKAKADMKANVALGSSIYHIKIELKTANGKVYTLSQLNYPITISLATNRELESGKSGVYYFPEADPIEYVDSKLEQKRMTASLNHLSEYATLQINKSFEDVASSHWARYVIEALYAKQIVKGVSDTTFLPERSITRAEFTAMLVRAMKLEGTMSLLFKDVSSQDWFAQDISAAMAAGIINGKSSDSFDPHASITREEMAAIIVRAYDLQHGEPELSVQAKPFNDAEDISSWAIDYVNQAAALELIKGRSGDLFAPKASLTRAEATQVLYNLLFGITN